MHRDDRPSTSTRVVSSSDLIVPMVDYSANVRPSPPDKVSNRPAGVSDFDVLPDPGFDHPMPIAVATHNVDA